MSLAQQTGRYVIQCKGEISTALAKSTHKNITKVKVKSNAFVTVVTFTTFLHLVCSCTLSTPLHRQLGKIASEQGNSTIWVVINFNGGSHVWIAIKPATINWSSISYYTRFRINEIRSTIGVDYLRVWYNNVACLKVVTDMHNNLAGLISFFIIRAWGKESETY